jgi:hypothetical protein
MPRRHTLPDPRKLPHSGRRRLAIRKGYVASQAEDGFKTHLPAHVVGWFKEDGTIEERDGVDPEKVSVAFFSGHVIYSRGANRDTRRRLAKATRLKNGRARIEQPISRRTAAGMKKTA